MLHFQLMTEEQFINLIMDNFEEFDEKEARYLLEHIRRFWSKTPMTDLFVLE